MFEESKSSNYYTTIASIEFAVTQVGLKTSVTKRKVNEFFYTNKDNKKLFIIRN